MPPQHLPPIIPTRGFRLLKFVEITGGNLLICELKAVDDASLSEEYHALSYVWGDAALCQVVICNGNFIRITSNLCNALSELWRQYPERRIWADAICIDQEDAVEKNAQIAEMGNIYSRASSVLIWLGKQISDINTGRLFSWLNADAPYTPPSMCDDCKYSFSADCHHIAKDMAAYHQHQLGEWLNQLLDNAWFERMWTFQEICLAQTATLHLGASSVNWDKFVLIIRRLGRYPNNVVQKSPEVRVLERVRAARRAREAVGETETLEHVMTATRYRQTTEPRDKIRAVLGLLPSDRLHSLKTAEANESAASIYAEAARTLYHDEDRVDILTKAWTCKPKGTTAIQDLPSWSPDWQDPGCLDPGGSAVRGPTSMSCIPDFVTLLRTPALHQKLSYLQAYFIVLGTLANTKTQSQLARHTDDTYSQATGDKSLCLISLPSCVPKTGNFMYVGSDPALLTRDFSRFSRFSALASEADSSAVVQDPADPNNIKWMLNNHGKDCSCRSPPRTLTWAHPLLLSEMLQDGDWLGILANRNGNLSHHVTAVRPTTSGSFRFTGSFHGCTMPAVRVLVLSGVVFEEKAEKIPYTLVHVVLE